jgi:sec-independent protein translocase protein TatC
VFKLDPKAVAAPSQVRLRNFNPAEGFVVAFDIALYFAMAVSSPFWLFFLAQYILPALKARERKLLYTWLGWGLALFITGVVLTYFLLLPLALRASVQYSNLLGFDPYDWRADEYIGFSGKFMLGMGLGFQFPLVTLTLVKIGLLGYESLARYRRHVIVLSLILGAVLTTPEVITQVAMAVPMCLLYEACIWIAWYWERKEKRGEAAEASGEA